MISKSLLMLRISLISSEMDEISHSGNSPLTLSKSETGMTSNSIPTLFPLSPCSCTTFGSSSMEWILKQVKGLSAMKRA